MASVAMCHDPDLQNLARRARICPCRVARIRFEMALGHAIIRAMLCEPVASALHAPHTQLDQTLYLADLPGGVQSRGTVGDGIE